MLKKSVISKQSIGLFFSVIAAAGMLTAGDSFAFERKMNAVASTKTRHESVAEQRGRKVIAPGDKNQQRVTVQRQGRKVTAPRHERDIVSRRQHAINAPRDIRHDRVAVKREYRYGNRTAHVYNREHFPRYSGIHRHFPRHVSIRPRVGVIFSTLPVGYSTFWAADRAYYYYNGIYYNSVPSGYMVVNPPPVVVVREYPDVVEPPEAAQGWVSVTVSTLNVHSGPALNYPVIHQVTLNTLLEVYGIADGWVYVQIQNGEFGWILSAFTAEA